MCNIIVDMSQGACAWLEFAKSRLKFTQKKGSRSVLLYDGDVILAIKIIVKSAGTIVME